MIVEAFFLVLLFFLGASIGSFITMLAHRLRFGGDIFFGRSRCVSCEAELGVVDLVPVISFLVLRGKCRRCKKSFSWSYFLIEFFSGLLFVLLFVVLVGGFDLYSLNWWMVLLSLLLFVFLVVFVFVYDVRHSLIPDVVLASVFGLLCVVLVFLGLDFAIEAFAGSLVFGFLMLLIYRLVDGEKMGAGDVKYAFVLGLFLGLPQALYAFGLSFVIGSVVSVFLLFSKKYSLKSHIPFGVFMSVGSVIALFLSMI